MKTVILGDGQIGRALAEVMPEARVVTRNVVDLAKPATIEGFDWAPFEVIINTTAYTDVDGAETESGALQAQAVNADGVATLAAAATKYDLKLVHFSSDYVFDGTSTTPYTESAQPHPLSSYGKSKASGDLAAAKTPKHYIIRTSSVYYQGGKNFVDTMLRLGAERPTLSVVSDQIMRPTYAGDIATVVGQLLERNAEFGIYNCQNSGEPVSWAGFAEAIFQEAELSCKVTRSSTAEYAENLEHYAPRPAYGVLDLAKLAAIGIEVRDWHEALRAYIKAS
jgi:dTDP-4-dehydrorhamnose reductase